MLVHYQWFVKHFTIDSGKNNDMTEIKFAENLKALRVARGLTQEQLGKIIGVDKRTVSTWETGISEPNLHTIARLCDFFGETFDSLVT